jgi:hypothetical protein
MQPATSNRLAKFLLFCTTLFLILSLISGYGWYSLRKNRLKIENLSPTEVNQLVHQYLAKSPGAFIRAWFCPDIGYVLRPNVKIELWRDTFGTNTIGMRTHPVEKPANTFRVLFVGDSWTFGTGVKQEQAFPAQFEALANQHAGASQKIQAWTLALGGWNTENEMSAMEAFLERLEPDAVVVCPTENDIDGSQDAAPSGDWCRPFWPPEYDLGVKAPCWDSPLQRRLWSSVFGRIRKSELLLKRYKVPMFIFFVGGWRGGEPMAHHYVSQAGIEAPYLVVPLEFYGGQYGGGEQHYHHGSPLAYQVFGNLIYQMVEKTLNWKPLPDAVRAKRPNGQPVTAFLKTPPGNWLETYTKMLNDNLSRGILKSAETFVPGTPTAMPLAWGTMDWDNGLVRRSTVVLLVRKAGATKVVVHLERLSGLKYLYPLELKFTIPSFEKDLSCTHTISADGPQVQTFDVPIPADIVPGRFMEVMILAPRASLRDDFMPQCTRVVRMEQK